MLIEGSFEELAEELAQYIDNLKNDGSSIQSECAALLQENKKDEVLKKLVMGSQALNQAPEKGTAERKHMEQPG
jgi:translation initiation factor 3 subunit M